MSTAKTEKKAWVVLLALIAIVSVPVLGHAQQSQPTLEDEMNVSSDIWGDKLRHGPLTGLKLFVREEKRGGGGGDCSNAETGRVPVQLQGSGAMVGCGQEPYITWNDSQPDSRNFVPVPQPVPTPIPAPVPVPIPVPVPGPCG